MGCRQAFPTPNTESKDRTANVTSTTIGRAGRSGGRNGWCWSGWMRLWPQVREELPIAPWKKSFLVFVRSLLGPLGRAS